MGVLQSTRIAFMVTLIQFRKPVMTGYIQFSAQIAH